MKRLATTSTVVARKPDNSNAVNAAGGWRPAMDHVGIDVHKRESQLCMLNPEGEVTEVRISTTRERFRAVLGDQPRAKVLIESSTESEWVARCLEGLGHEVIVADPGFAPMYGMRRRRVKTDARDARALAEACRSGVYRLAHRRSEQQRRVTAGLVVREALVRSRTSFISVVRALLRKEGLRAASGSAEHFPERVSRLEMPGRLRSEVAPLLAAMVKENEQLAWCDAAVEEATKNDPMVALLRTAPRIGPVTAAAFRAVVDNVERFRGPHQLAAYLGLVPREKSSGETQHRGRITRAGDSRTRSLLVQASQRIRYSKVPETLGLRMWAKRIEVRRGKAVATVALARKLAGILFAMLRDGTPFDPGKQAGVPAALAA